MDDIQSTMMATSALALLQHNPDAPAQPGTREEWLAMEKRLKVYVKQCVDQMKAELKNELGAPASQQRGKAKPASTKGICFVCQGSTSVHRHREFEVYLDDRCRKQIETVNPPRTILCELFEFQRVFAAAAVQTGRHDHRTPRGVAPCPAIASGQ